MPPTFSRKYGVLSIEEELEGGAIYCIRAGNFSDCSKADVSYSSDRQRLTFAGQKAISQWDLKEGKCLSKILLEHSPREDCYQETVTLSPDGNVCARRETCGSQEKYQLLNCRSGKIIAQTPSRRCSVYSSCFFSSDSRTFVVWTKNRMRFFHARTAKQLWNLNITFDDSLTTLWVKPQNAPQGLVGIPNENGFEFFDARTGKVTRHLNHPTLQEIQSWNFSPDGKQIWWSTPKHEIFWRDLD